jgi:hypothetical protein
VRAKAAAAPKPSAVPDRLPSRAVDSRVVSVNFMAAGAGRRASGIVVAPPGEPFLITIPIRDLSIVQWDAATGRSGGVDIGQGGFLSPILNVTCPATLEAARARGIASRIIGPPALLASARAAASLTTTTATTTTSTAANGTLSALGSGGALAAAGAPDSAPPLPSGVGAA